MEISSHKLNFEQTIKNGRDGIVVYDSTFYKITYINKHETTIRKGSNSLTFPTIHLHSYGKTGNMNSFGTILPFFIYKKQVPRKDAPKVMIEGTDYTEVVTDNLVSLRESNLTTHIVQVGKTNVGGVVISDNGHEVTVKLRGGKIQKIDKEYLHYIKVHYLKKSYKKLWFRFESGKPIKYGSLKTAMNTKGNSYKEYVDLQTKFDENYEKSDDYKVYTYHKLIHDQLRDLWNKLTPRQKEKVTK